MSDFITKNHNGFKIRTKEKEQKKFKKLPLLFPSSKVNGACG